MTSNLSLDQIILGDSIKVLQTLPEKCVDVVFADPPYNMQLNSELYRPNMTKVDAVDDEWDKFDNFEAYDKFTHDWLMGCRRVLKDQGTIWVIGSYHNIYRVGKILMDLEFWMLNDIIWHKTNPMPNFKGTRFTNAHETLLWAQKCQGAPYTFNYHAMKMGNEDKQMRNVWELPICSGKERIMVNGEKAHTTQKPEALLYRVISSSTKPGDVVLDPFFGTGTTGAVAKKLHRHWIGIERDANYASIAQNRIDAIVPPLFSEEVFGNYKKPVQKRIPFIRLLEMKLLTPGQQLRLGKKEVYATVAADGSLVFDGQKGSIHQIGTKLMGAPCNGWTNWHFQDSSTKEWKLIDVLREEVKKQEPT